ncbi:peptidase M15 [Halorhodospira abdelmalekii]|uniref:DNA phosphorothioation-associated putative methyltransferase n=1 Tax=Halorhodospira abdelmalekii TaxID=421629 RepID=UPI001908B308|nr:DNA phosphorothioation-associated putative methyltransferase [Halorhodospira abdelmalekii]MBK1735427.1 peptidase M15 [Halorhodospira abdelmalekii]
MLGKRIGRRTYLHVTALVALDEPQRSLWERAIETAAAVFGLRSGESFNVVRLELDATAVPGPENPGPENNAGCDGVSASDPGGGELAGVGEIALLHYPDFFDDPFPALAESWRYVPKRRVSSGSEAVETDKSDEGDACGVEAVTSYRSYRDSLNPPILHRKELLLAPDHPSYAIYAELTAAAETIGLFDDTTRIGYQRQWLAQVREAGYRIAGHALVPLSPEEREQSRPSADDWEAARQRTALVRYDFSTPVQSLARHGFLDGRYSLFDYGCGRGDDVRGLRENGIAASGWDPYYAAEAPRHSADLVNLGFVINVIEDFDERLEALLGAWSLTQRLLVVAVMLANDNDPRGVQFRDGVITQRGTFQKYFTQGEIKAFLERALDEEAIPVAPGVLYLFRDKDLEQHFLLERYRSRGRRLRPASSGSAERRRMRTTEQRAPCQPAAERRAAERYAAHREPLERLWAQWLTLGRKPDKEEVADRLALTEGFGGVARALRFLEQRQRLELGDEAVTALLAEAEARRQADLEVYFALLQFERRPPYRHLDPTLRRDVRYFFGDYQGAQAAGRERLLQIADPSAVAQACQEAAENGLGHLHWERAGHGSLQLHSSLVERLPALLRIYVGAAALLYGDWRNADLVKIHIGSGKLTLMRFDDFDGQALPRMLERVKIKLREQEFDYFSYGDEYEPPYLYWKSRYLHEEHPRYPEQCDFDEALAELGLLDLSGYGPPPAVLRETLARHRWEIDGLTLRRSRTPPQLDDPCGRFLTFRDLIECGETWQRLADKAATEASETGGTGGIDNRPQQVESWNALLDLAEQVLDPVIDWFGMIRLTYAFSSPQLTKQIPGRIDPKRDQHAAHELNRRGKLICERRGAAVDFLVEDEDMWEVAQWVAAHTPFDRLYFYAADRPIHVSYGPEHNRQVVWMREGPSGRRVPQVVRGKMGTD